VSKLKFQQEENCTCGRTNKISTGVNTSIELPKSNSNSTPTSNYQNGSKRSITSKNTKIHEKENPPRGTKTDDDYRFDNFLNENSINFPKQFLEIDSNVKDEYHSNTIKKKDFSNFGMIEKNYRLMHNQTNIFTPTNNNNSIDFTSLNNIDHNLGNENYGDFQKKTKEIKTNLIYNNPTNIDLTSNSIDPTTYRYALKVPSMIIKSGNSIINDDQEEGQFHSSNLDYLKKVLI